jgi:DNA polymerase III epsilon subunit-like protein
MRDAWPDWIKKDVLRMVSVDVETAGPNPADYALLSIGACTLTDPREEFYVELQPTTMKADANALEVHHLDLLKLSRTGEPPARAMQLLADWLAEVINIETHPLFLGFNAPFDWMFVCDYFHRFLGHNPFGHSALDIKSFYMGLSHVEWKGTSMASISTTALRHNALEDACDQAKLFKRIVIGSEQVLMKSEN